MNAKLVVFMDDAELLPDLSETQDVVIISLDSQAASEIAARPGIRIKDFKEFAETRFASYDELYDFFRADLRESLRPKDSTRQSQFLFEAFWDDILLNVTPLHYIEVLIRQVLIAEQPARFEFAISDRQMDSLFRSIVKQIS